MEDRFGHRISYLRVSITDRCNERCTYCMPQELQEWLPREDILTLRGNAAPDPHRRELGVSKVRVTGGEPLTRRDVLSFCEMLRAVPGIDDIGLSTNGTLLARETCSRGVTMAQRCARPACDSVNISLDTLDREVYAQTTGRDFLPQALAGIDAAIAAGFELIKLNCVLMRGRNEDQLIPLVEFAAERNLILRFIELMPVSTSEVLDEDNFLPIREAQRRLESHYGALIPEPYVPDQWPGDLLQDPGSRPAHRVHRRDDESAFLRELQQTAPDLRREIAALPRQLSRVRHHETDARRRERRGAGALLPRRGRSQTGAARLPRKLPAGPQDGRDRRLKDGAPLAHRGRWQRADGRCFGESR